MIILPVLTVLTFPASVSGQESEDLPTGKTVYVRHAAAHARCGPGGDFYRTDALRIGQKLQVHVETPDGWLGIRPPDTSYCWIPADAVTANQSVANQLHHGATATVIGEDEVAYIGTHLGRARQYRWQVQLQSGETVTIIGQAARQGENGTQLWYRIVPPSGEFRWVHRQQVTEDVETLIADMSNQRGSANPCVDCDLDHGSLDHGSQGHG
ncbi:MAG: hypothetical protein AAFP69_24350, partial [Planctomycetota bacterium]